MKTAKYQILTVNRMARAFWTLNGEMVPANKATFVRELDVSAMEEVRQRYLELNNQKPSYTSFVVKAAAIALQELPYANRAIIGRGCFKELVQFEGADITVAIERTVPDAEAVVLADTIRNSQEKSLIEINDELKAFVTATPESNERWRLFSSLLSRLPVFISRWVIGSPRYFTDLWVKHRGGACFVNSPAKYGVDFLVADMIWPLTVTYGWVKERPIVVKGQLAVRKTMPLTIIFDRRIMAGAPAARFFNRLAQILEQASTILDESGK